VFVFAYKLFREAGFSIAAVSLAFSILCHPIYTVAERWQKAERNIQRRMAGKIAKIKAVFRGDERYMILSAFYRQNHYHPAFALRSSLGLLLQIPFFIAAYSYISGAEILKGTPFLFIHDLGAPDGLLPCGFNALPVIMTAFNIISTLIYTRGFSAKERLPLFLMAAVFLILLYNSPSALVLYWTGNNIFSLCKNLYYAITYKQKQIVLFALISLSALALAFYAGFIHHGAIQVRFVITAASIILSALPWAYIFILKRFKQIHAALKAAPINSCNEKENRGVYILSFSVLWILAGIFVPSELIASAPQEFSFLGNSGSPLSFILNTTIQAFGFYIIWPLILYALFSSKIKIFMSYAGIALLVSSLCSVFIFPGNYGLIANNLVYDGGVVHSQKEIAVNFLLISAAAFLTVLLCMRLKKNIVRAAIGVIIFAVSGVCAVNIAKINNAFNKLAAYHTEKERSVKTIEPLFHLSTTGKNVLVIMLDRAISVFVPEIFKESPDLDNIYTGFVYYPNTVSFNGYTRIGAPPLYGGYDYTPLETNKRDDVSLKQKLNEALLLMPRIFSAGGFEVTITDPPYANDNWIPDLRIFDNGIHAYITDSVYTNAWLEEHSLNIPSLQDRLNRNLLWYSVFKTAPFALRQGLYEKGDWCSPIPGQRLLKTLNGYSVLDYLPRLTDFNPRAKDTLTIITNNTTHEVSLLQAPDYKPALFVNDYGTSRFKKEGSYHINAASFKRLAEYFSFLKQNGVYDNTRIIIVSDHGPVPNFLVKLNLPFNVEQFNPLLMVKDFNARGIMQTDMTFMSNADVPYLATDGIIENPVNPFLNTPITTDYKRRPLYIAVSGSIFAGKNGASATKYALDPKRDYYVRDNIFDASNWTRADSGVQEHGEKMGGGGT
jgi:hypothetical protein